MTIDTGKDQLGGEGETRLQKALGLIKAKRSLSSLQSTTKGLLIVGHLSSSEDRQAVLQLSEKLKWPLLADISSGLATVNKQNSVRYYNLLMTSDNFAGKAILFR